MDTAQYVNRPDYTTAITYHNGYVETFRHCGRCLSIIPKKVCQHCAVREEKAEQHKTQFRAFLAKRKEGG